MRRVLFDVSGLVQWYAYLSNPSGIQRLTENILGQAVLAGQPHVTFVARAIGSDAFYEIKPSLITGLTRAETRRSCIASLRALFAASMRRAQPLRLLRELRSIHLPYIALGFSFTERFWESYCAGSWPANRRPLRMIDPSSGYDAIVGLGDFWCHRDHVRGLIELKRRSGARLIHLIHDLVAVVSPHWTHPHYGQEFVEQLGQLAPQVDHWLATSNYVAGQLSAYLQSLDLPGRPIDVVPIGWPRTGGPHVGPTDEVTLRKYGLRSGSYMLHVGTVEPRKNLGALFDALSGLSYDDGLLVLVGRDGWRSETIRQRLENDGMLAARVKWIKDAPDAELAALYRAARFTVVPSFDEGWGLAVQESLAQGTPCIASRVGGIPEAGLGLPLYVPSNDVRALREAISVFMGADGALERRREAIAHRLSSTTRPSWADTAETISRVMAAPAPGEPSARPASCIQSASPAP